MGKLPRGLLRHSGSGASGDWLLSSTVSKSPLLYPPTIMRKSEKMSYFIEDAMQNLLHPTLRSCIQIQGERPNAKTGLKATETVF